MKSIAVLLLGVLATAQVFAADITGSYQGEFGGRKGTLTLTNNNGYALTFVGVDGSSDLIGEGCNSVVGPVAEVKMKNGEVKSLAFEFSAGTCFQVEGRELFVKVKTNQVSLSLYSHSESMRSCNFDPSGRQYCHDDYWPVYADGKFVRTK